jgi:hypothetical protein
MSSLISFIDFIERINNIDMNIDVLERSINEQGEIIKPCSGSFVDNLEKVIITNEDVDNELCCAICRDKFKLGDKVIKLPCNDPHFFHYNSDPELCNGILPWLKNNNTCPICREEFPLEPVNTLNASETIDNDNNLEQDNNDEEAVEQILESIVRNITSNPIPNMEIQPNFREIPPPINLRRTILLPFRFNRLPIHMNNIYPQEPYDPDLQEAIRRSLED